MPRAQWDRDTAVTRRRAAYRTEAASHKAAAHRMGAAQETHRMGAGPEVADTSAAEARPVRAPCMAARADQVRAVPAPVRPDSVYRSQTRSTCASLQCCAGASPAPVIHRAYRARTCFTADTERAISAPAPVTTSSGQFQILGASARVGGRADATAHSCIQGATSGSPSGRPMAPNSSSCESVPPLRFSIRLRMIARA